MITDVKEYEDSISRGRLEWVLKFEEHTTYTCTQCPFHRVFRPYHVYCELLNIRIHSYRASTCTKIDVLKWTLENL